MAIKLKGSAKKRTYCRAFSLPLKFEGQISGKERQLAGGARQLVSSTAPVMNESFSLKELLKLESAEDWTKDGPFYLKSYD